jgi:hypothetical protein
VQNYQKNAPLLTDKGGDQRGYSGDDKRHSKDSNLLYKIAASTKFKKDLRLVTIHVKAPQIRVDD